MTFYGSQGIHNGGCSLIGRAVDCGSTGYEFEFRESPLVKFVYEQVGW